MQYNYKYRLDPTETLTETLLHHVDTCRQLYNHVLYKLDEANEVPARYKIQGTLPTLKSCLLPTNRTVVVREQDW